MSRHKPGGRFLGYAESLDLDLSAVGRTSKVAAPEGYPVPYIATNKVKISCAKNSLGETHNYCHGYVRWHYYLPRAEMQKPTQPRQLMRWLWGKSLVELLDTTSDHCKLDSVGKARLREICYVQPVVKSTDLWQCKQLPHTAKGVPAELLGQEIETNPGMCHELQTFFAVTQYDVFQPLSNYVSQLQVQRKAKAKADKDSDNE